MSQRDREGELTLEYRLPPNLATHPTATAKQEPEMSRPPLGEGGRREPDGRGELAGYLDCPTTNAPTPATAKQEPEKAVPLGGRWRRQATEGGNSLSILDCPTTNAPTPATAKQEPALKPRLPPNKDTEPSLPSMELRGGGPDRARRGVTPSRNHHSLST